MTNEDVLLSDLIHTARLCRTLRAELLTKHGLYPSQDTLLKCLEDEDGQSMGALAGKMKVRPPTITKMVTRMSAQGFVKKEPSQTDNRQSHVFITNKGSKLLKKVDKAWRKAEKTALADVKPKRQRKLLKSLRKINESVCADRERREISVKESAQAANGMAD